MPICPKRFRKIGRNTEWRKQRKTVCTEITLGMMENIETQLGHSTGFDELSRFR